MNESAESWFRFALFAGGAVFAGLLAHVLLFGLLRRVARRTDSAWNMSVAQRTATPARIVFPLVLLEIVLPDLGLNQGLRGASEHGLDLALIACAGWLLLRVVDVLGDVATTHALPGPEAESATARRRLTRFHILRRALGVLIVTVTLAAMLLTFDKVRTLGASLLASAGIAALLVGLAVRPTVSNLLSGLQLAFTEAIRIGDAVIVEGEEGDVEEITFTYVSVRLWDGRQLILPIGYFTEKPFQNWTRRSTARQGTVVLFADYTVPVGAVRERLRTMVEAHPLWDKKAWALEVTDATERTVQLRALVSAADGGALWKLRCDVREQLIDFLQTEHPGCLPKVRTHADSAS
jgi:small-conductance mechanosensitive channel